MANKKRIATSVAAVATAAALLLGGTFAWQSINQTALNEASDVINPGGRLHDDFNGENKDIYVENFAEEPIYARIQLGEYFEIITNFGAANEDIVKSTQILGSKNDDGTYNYETFYFDGNVDENGAVNAGGSDEEGNPYWTWQTGGSTVYMPTFNMNKDSLAADINGIYEGGNVGTISDRFNPDDPQYSEYTNWAEFEGENGVVGEGADKSGTEIYDADSNNVEETDGSGTTTVDATHTSKSTGDAELMSMQQWIAGGSAEGPYWVYDTDGWVYWAQAIEPETATGLLLDGIELNQVMDDSWYYAINVVAQFVTADDVGKTDGTGFYVTGTEPTEEAVDLLRTIGVTSVDDTPGGGSGDPVVPESPLQLTLTAAPNWYLGSSSVEAEVDLTASAAYEETDIVDVSSVSWSISGNTVEETALSAKSGETVTLTIAPFEEGNIIVSATFTYKDDEQGINETVTEEIVVTNGPSVGTMWVFNNAKTEPEGFYANTTYTPGTEQTFNLTTYFFPNYTGTIQPISAAYSGEAAALLAQKYSCSLAEEYDGVTFDQNGANMTVTIGETVTDTISINCELENYGTMTYEIQPESAEGDDEDPADLPESETYSIYAEDMMMASRDGTLALTVQDAEANPYAGEIVWSSNSSDLTINESGEVSFTGEMTSALQEYTATATLNGTEKATATVYVYDDSKHGLAGVTMIDSENYYVFTHYSDTAPYIIDIPQTYICVYKQGDAVGNLYYWGTYPHMGSYEDMVNYVTENWNTFTKDSACPFVNEQ